MIEAIIVCVALDNSMRSCSTWFFKEPMERNAYNERVVVDECDDIIKKMAAQGFEVTCEEAKE